MGRYVQQMKQQIAVNIDEHNAVLVRDTQSGNLRQYCEHGLFLPGPYEQIVEVSRRLSFRSSNEWHTRMRLASLCLSLATQRCDISSYLPSARLSVRIGPSICG